MDEDDPIIGECADAETMKIEKEALYHTSWKPKQIIIKMKGSSQKHIFQITAVCRSEINSPTYEADEWKIIP